MSKVDRLDFSKPPNGYLVWFDDGWSCVCWGLEDDGQAINTPDDNLTEDAAIAASWDHYKARHDPPGLTVFRDALCGPGNIWWVGDAATMRGLSSHRGKAAACTAAWAWYEDALELADILDGENGPAETWPDRYSWPRPLRWTAEQRADVRRLCHNGGDWSEVIRAL